MPKPDEAPVKPEDGVLEKSAFLASVKVSPETLVVEGCKVRALTRQQFQEIKVLQSEQGFSKKSRAAFELAEDAAILSCGVVSPAMDFSEWMHLLKDADQAKIETIIAAIRELSGMIPVEQQIAKKALSEILDTSRS